MNFSLYTCIVLQWYTVPVERSWASQSLVEPSTTRRNAENRETIE